MNSLIPTLHDIHTCAAATTSETRELANFFLYRVLAELLEKALGKVSLEDG